MTALIWIFALALLLAGAFMVLTDAHDIWRARDFWRSMRIGQPQPVPDYWDNRYVTAELTLMTPKIIGGALLGLAGAVLALVQIRRNRAAARS